MDERDLLTTVTFLTLFNRTYAEAPGLITSRGGFNAFTGIPQPTDPSRDMDLIVLHEILGAAIPRRWTRGQDIGMHINRNLPRIARTLRFYGVENRHTLRRLALYRASNVQGQSLRAAMDRLPLPCTEVVSLREHYIDNDLPRLLVEVHRNSRLLGPAVSALETTALLPAPMRDSAFNAWYQAHYLPLTPPGSVNPDAALLAMDTYLEISALDPHLQAEARARRTTEWGWG